MKWYGSNNYSKLHLKSFIKNYNYRHNLETRNLAFSFKSIFYFERTITHVCIPHNWNFIVLNKNKSHYNFYLYSHIYFFFFSIPLNSYKFNYDKYEQIIKISTRYKNMFTNLYWLLFNQVFFSFITLFFRKIKFKGKGYYIYKDSRSTITPQFGYAHRIYVYAYMTNVEFLTKTKILLFGLNKLEIWSISQQIFNIKPINIFTGRGMRFSKQIIYRKPGKISLYR